MTPPHSSHALYLLNWRETFWIKIIKSIRNLQFDDKFYITSTKLRNFLLFWEFINLPIWGSTQNMGLIVSAVLTIIRYKQINKLTRLTADPLNLMPSQSRLELRANFFSQRVVNLWNSLPGEVKNARNPKVFKYIYQRYAGDIVWVKIVM